LATSFQYYGMRSHPRFLREIFSELANIGLFLAPWLISLGTLYLLVWKNVISRYELYPATPLDPFLYHPLWWPIVAIVTAFALAWAAVCLARYSFALWGNPEFAASKAVCLDALLTISIIALIFNGFAATLFLAPAALLWVWIEQGTKPKALVRNVVVALLGALPFILICVMLTKNLALGRYLPWYLLLGAGYGFFSLQAVLLAVGAVTVGGRLLQKSLSQISTSPEVDTESSGD